MVMCKRYLDIIRPFYNQELIKVLIGIRRSGKSVILGQIMDELIVMRIDEIQNVESWEKVVNSLRATKNTSIFITSSNSDLLSSDLATHIAGRYVSFKITPFTFKEVCEYLNVTDKSQIKDVFYGYIKWGGMPQRFMQQEDFSRKAYLNDIYDSIVIKDIVKRFRIKDVDLLNRIVTYILTTPSQMFSPESLKKYMMSESRIVSLETLYNYLDCNMKVNLISKVEGYGVCGKRILTGKYKYYLTDLGFNNILSEGKKNNLEHI